MNSSYENSKKELIQVCTFDGYEIENPRWVFQHYAVVVKQGSTMTDIFDGNIYQMREKKEVLEKGDIRGMKSVFNSEFQEYMVRCGSGLQQVEDYLEFSGIHVPYGFFPYSQRSVSENGYLNRQKNLVLSYMRSKR